MVYEVEKRRGSDRKTNKESKGKKRFRDQTREMETKNYTADQEEK